MVKQSFDLTAKDTWVAFKEMLPVAALSLFLALHLA